MLKLRTWTRKLEKKKHNAAEDSDVLGYYGVSAGTQLPTFRRTALWDWAVQEGFTLFARQHGAALQKIRILYATP